MNILGITASSSKSLSVVTCAYPLDSNLAQVSAFGFDGLLPMSGPNLQQATYAIQSGLVSGERFAAFPSGAPASERVIVPTEGVALAVNLGDLPDFTGEDASALQIALWLEDAISPGGGPSFAATFASNFDGTFDIGAGLSPSVGGAINILKPQQFCIYLRQTEVPAGGTEAGLSVVYNDGSVEDFGFYDTDASRELIPILIVREGTGLDAGLAGETVNAEFVTAASSIIAPVPAGYLDVCGNVI